MQDLVKFLKLDDVFKLNKTSFQNLTYLDYTDLLEQANRLNKDSKCSSISRTEFNQLNNYEKEKSCFCQTAFKTISHMPEDIQVLFKQVKPILFGKILYSPNTIEYTNLIIQKANTTFQNIHLFSKLIGKLASLAEQTLLKLNLTTEENIENFEFNLKIFSQDFFNSNLNNLDIKTIVYKMKYYIQIFYFIQNSIDCFEINKFIGYPSEEEAIREGIDKMDKESLWAFVVFENKTNNLPKLINYKIRMNASRTQDTAYTKFDSYSFEPHNCPTCNPYFLYGFIYIQDLIEKAIVELKTNKSQEFGISAQMTPYPCHILDKFLIDISKSLPLFMVISWLYTVSTMVKDIVYEKEKRLKEFMQIMGLSNGTYWFSWFISSFLVMFFVSILICLTMKIGKITVYSDLSLLITFFACFAVATINQCFLISIFFNKASLASVVAGIAFFVCFLPYTILINYSESLYAWQKFFLSLLSPVAFSYGAEIMATFELETKGIKWSNINSSPFSSGFTIGTMCAILLFDAFVYMILTWYIEHLYPGEFGVSKKWYFPFQKSFWFGDWMQDDDDLEDEKGFKFFKCFKNSSTKRKKQIIEEIMFKSESELEEAKRSNEAIDSDKINEEPGIEIKNLHKIYSRGNNHALKGLTVNFYQNEISAFLGHNGAGELKNFFEFFYLNE